MSMSWWEGDEARGLCGTVHGDPQLVGFSSGGLQLHSGARGNGRKQEIQGSWGLPEVIYRCVYNIFTCVHICVDIQWWLICPHSWKLWIDTQVNWNKTKDISSFCKLWRCLQNVNPQKCQGYTGDGKQYLFHLPRSHISGSGFNMCFEKITPQTWTKKFWKDGWLRPRDPNFPGLLIWVPPNPKLI